MPGGYGSQTQTQQPDLSDYVFMFSNTASLVRLRRSFMVQGCRGESSQSARKLLQTLSFFVPRAQELCCCVWRRRLARACLDMSKTDMRDFQHFSRDTSAQEHPTVAARLLSCIGSMRSSPSFVLLKQAPWCSHQVSNGGVLMWYRAHVSCSHCGDKFDTWRVQMQKVIENHHTMWHVLVVACATPSDTESRACRCWTVTFAFRVAPCRNLIDSMEMPQANGTKVEWCRVSGAHVSGVDMEAGQARQRQRWPAARESDEAWTKCHV